MNEVDRASFNIIGAVLLGVGMLVGTVLYVETYVPYKMAQLGYVETEGGRYVPHNAARIESVEKNYVALVKDLKEAMNKIQRQLDKKKDK